MNIETTKWISVSTKDLTLPEKRETISGVEIRLGVSPYDIPTAVKGGYDEELDRFVIEFRYVDEGELTKYQVLDNNIAIEHGIHSGRIHKLYVNVKALGARAIELGVVNQSLSLLPQAIRGRGENLELVKQVIAKRRNELFRNRIEL